MPTSEKMRALAGWLDEKKARRIKALDLSGLSSVADGLLVATADSARHAQALADHLLAMAGEAGMAYLGMEGYRTGTWILLDLGDVLVHLFQEPARLFYNLEGLWAEAGELSLDLPPDMPDVAEGAGNEASVDGAGDQEE
jgi:ribosome-associated protein